MTRPITVICGGVGAARFLRSLLQVVPARDVTAIVNTGDDTIMHGLHISPDLDTVTYTIADAIDPERGWGLVDETWQAMDALSRYTEVRPDDSRAGATWFGLGDRDLATHLYRTARLAEGATLTEVTAEITQAWEIGIDILPMSDELAPTMVGIDPTIDPGSHGDGIIPFQDYFVRHRHAIPTRSLHLGAASATPSEQALVALADSEVVLIAPSNPLVSIGPIRAMPGIDQIMAERRGTVVAISPLVGGAALKGPAAQMMSDAGYRPDAVGVAEAYAPIAGTLIIDDQDRDLATLVSEAGMNPIVTNTIMADPSVGAALAATALNAARG